MVRRVTEAEGCALTTGQAGWAFQVECILGNEDGTATGPDAMPSELLQAGASECGEVDEGTPLMWKGVDMALVPHKLGPIATAKRTSVLLGAGKMVASAMIAAHVDADAHTGCW